MSTEWIIVELISVLVENLVSLYFLNSRYKSKYNSVWPQLGTWGLLVLSGFATNISSYAALSFAAYGILLVYLIIFKTGKFLYKVFGVLLVGALELGVAIVGIGLASMIDSTSIEHVMEYQDTTRLLAILFAKMLQVVIFYVLAKKQTEFRELQKRPALVLSGAAILDFAFLFLIGMYAVSSDLQTGQYRFLVWLAVGALFVLIAIFVIYELFIREEMKNVEMAMKLQRLELESIYYTEISNMYSDLRTWKHDYKNNLSALRALVESVETGKALSFIDSMYGEAYKKQIMLQTGNLVLDAIVNSKLWLAQSRNIEVSIQAVYPDNNRISDNDLCAMAGNLIDNAVEACVRMGESGANQFINFSIMLKGSNLLLSIKNSYTDELRREGSRYLTVKSEPFHGIGIPRIDAIVKKYQGHVLRSQENGVFETDIILPLLAPEEGGI